MTPTPHVKMSLAFVRKRPIIKEDGKWEIHWRVFCLTPMSVLTVTWLQILAHAHTVSQKKNEKICTKIITMNIFNTMNIYHVYSYKKILTWTIFTTNILARKFVDLRYNVTYTWLTCPGLTSPVRGIIDRGESSGVKNSNILGSGNLATPLITALSSALRWGLQTWRLATELLPTTVASKVTAFSVSISGGRIPVPLQASLNSLRSNNTKIKI